MAHSLDVFDLNIRSRAEAKRGAKEDELLDAIEDKLDAVARKVISWPQLKCGDTLKEKSQSNIDKINGHQ